MRDVHVTDLTNDLQVIDLVDEMEWEDHTLFLSLEEAGLEEDTNAQPLFGDSVSGFGRTHGSVPEYVAWFSDGEDSRFECN